MFINLILLIRLKSFKKLGIKVLAYKGSYFCKTCNRIVEKGACKYKKKVNMRIYLEKHLENILKTKNTLHLLIRICKIIFLSLKIYFPNL